MTTTAGRLWPALILTLLVACAQPEAAGSSAAGTTIAAPPSPTVAATTVATPALPTPAAIPAGAWIALSPASGPPGAAVQMRGHVPGGPTAANAGQEWQQHGTICWAGCFHGLMIETGGVVWSRQVPGDFTLRFTVPDQPWLAANGPHPLMPGDYAVAIQCLGVLIKGYAVQPAAATATFHLLGPAPARCLWDRPCARLRFVPAAAAPGAAVAVQGWAALTAISGGQIRQAPDGTLTGSFRVLLALPGKAAMAPGTYTIALAAIHSAASRPGATPVAGATVTPIGKGSGADERIVLAATPFTTRAAPSWAGLGAITPLWVQHGGFNQPIQSDPQNPGRVAYCAPGGIHFTADGGTTWTLIATAGAARIAAQRPYSLAISAAQTGGSPPACAAVTLDPDHPPASTPPSSPTGKRLATRQCAGGPRRRRLRRLPDQRPGEKSALSA